MESEINLTDTLGRVKFFEKSLLINLKFWQIWLEERSSDTKALDREYECIERSIIFTLNSQNVSDEIWQSTFKLIELFAPYMERRGHWDSWNETLLRARYVANLLEDLKIRADLTVLLARLARRQSHLKDAIRYYRQAIRYSRQINYQFNEGRACTNLGFIFIEQGYWHRAELLCCHALKIFKHLGSKHGLAHTENHLGILYTQQGQPKKAQDRLENACNIWYSLGDNYGLLDGYNSLGKLFNDNNCPDEALRHLEKALHYAKVVGDQLGTGIIHLNTGIAFRLKGEHGQAKKHFCKAENLFREYSYSVGLALVLDNFGLLQMARKEWNDANIHLSTALEAWRNLKDRHGEIRTMTYLAQYELEQGHQQQALMWLKQSEQLLLRYDRVKRYYRPQKRVQVLRNQLKNWQCEDGS